ncbi:CheR family methyltransferase [Mucilaginibacter sp. AW1-7]|jgi:chemotaxis protein methyltransferase CheR|uniref:CheR family methyltransferase n=1 Tax=unclassified Mucilaginibacter TaxID=2617802 RepID=UPI0008D36904|nr:MULTISPECIES: protein-glutamate O-methyltransferase CheR [unclassified Mucilaginibacter]WDF76233.1 protein-glutamate O-methyltransferase CheR [Mucilaginibacter sp. KACC 22773]SEP43932.1 chemotaxis protein methyltransferase CheR [Mucilaginibacter sp. OK283]
MTDTNLPITASQITELIDLVKKVHGFDFSGYTKASLKRRISRIMQLKKLSFYDLKHILVNNPEFFQEFLEEITVNVTEMFRDPSFYKGLNSQVIPYLSTYQHSKIWVAGCSTGEEVYSIAILLREAGLSNKSFIYGTDINTEVLREARRGIYSLRNIKSYAENYQFTGLKGSISDHFTILYDAASIHNELKQNTLFSVHNLVSDGIFNEFQLISCRNVFIYFETELQEHILELFYKSLCPLGYLCLGSKETIRSDTFKKKFKVINSKENIYQKIGS